MIGYVCLWLGTFAQVFLMGLQSRNVNTGRFAQAAFTSLALTCTNLVFIRAAVEGDPWLFLAVSGTAGPAGIITSMLLARRLYGAPAR